MKTLACMTAALGLLGALAAVNPAAAASGQCFDAYGRPVGPPHNTDNPPYGLICSVYRQGGQCTHVQPQWAAANCGFTPRGSYRQRYQYDDERGRGYRSYRYDRGSNTRDREIRRQQRVDPGLRFIPQTDPNQPPVPDRGPPNSAR